MEARERANFVNSYSRFVAAVWTDDAAASRLASDPRAAVAEFGLEIPSSARVEVVRDAEGDPNLEAQVEKWEEGRRTGLYTLYVPRQQTIQAGELSEADLEAVAGGLDLCCCCTPCCCCS